MKKFFTLILLGLIILSSSLMGCKKEVAAVVTTPKTKTELISSGSWKFSKAMVGSMDVSAALRTCQKDNIITFQANGSGTVDEGLTKCDPGDNQTTPFTWNFANSEQVLHVSAVFFLGGNNDINLITLNATELTGSQNITVGSSTQTAVVTFIH